MVQVSGLNSNSITHIKLKFIPTLLNEIHNITLRILHQFKQLSILKSSTDHKELISIKKSSQHTGLHYRIDLWRSSYRLVWQIGLDNTIGSKSLWEVSFKCSKHVPSVSFDNRWLKMHNLWNPEPRNWLLNSD